MSRTDDLEEHERQRRPGQSSKLRDWAVQLEALARMLWDANRKNGWHVRYGYLDDWDPDPQLEVLVMIDGAELVRFARDEHGIVGVFERGRPQRFGNRGDAFDAAVRRRIARQTVCDTRTL